MSIKLLLRRSAQSVALFLAFALTVVAAEKHAFGYLWRSAQLTIYPAYDARGHDPQLVLERGLVQGDDTPLTVLAVGDIVDCPDPDGLWKDLKSVHSWLGLHDPINPAEVPASATVALAQNWPDAPILALGDIVYQKGTPDEFANCFDPIWGDLKDRTLPVPGNHEYYTPAAFPYYDYWGRQTGPDRRGYYAVASDHWLILALNSETDAGQGSAQALWLSNVLESTTKPCILAYFHRPAYASDERPGAEVAQDLFRLLAAHGADIVLNGHVHYYERMRPLNGNGEVSPEGITTYIVGTGGRRPKTGVSSQSFSDALMQGEIGMLELTLGNGTYASGFHAVGQSEPLDQTERFCRGA